MCPLGMCQGIPSSFHVGFDTFNGFDEYLSVFRLNVVEESFGMKGTDDLCEMGAFDVFVFGRGEPSVDTPYFSVIVVTDCF
jgi:hypothetical protein